jgi:hypothetical protein
LAEAKTTVVATSVVAARRVAAHIGCCAEVGAWCRKLGADYALVAPSLRAQPKGRASPPGRSRGGRGKHRRGIAPANDGRKVRAGRLFKAMRRVGRVKAIRAKHRRRLLAAAILPVAFIRCRAYPLEAGRG